MKKLLLPLVLLLLTFSTYAGILRVNNITGVNTPYTTLAAAVSAAGNGDTIYLEPSPSYYGSATLTKKLTIIGNGYFNNTGLYSANVGLQANMAHNSLISDITFNAGSEFSTLMGCYVNGAVYIYASNITIKRNFVNSYIALNNYNSATATYTNVTNIDIRQNLLGYGLYAYQFSTSSNTVGITNVNVQNNIFYSFYTYLQLPAGISGFLMNNLIYSPYYNVDLYGFQVNNNIMTGGTFNANNNAYFNNASTGTAFGNLNGNQQNVSAASLFSNYGTGGADTSFVLNPSGAGIGTGFNGANLGPYGGPDPYKKSGIPPVPTIYSLSAPATTTTSTLPVTISTRSND